MILSDLRTLFKSFEQSSNTTHDWHQDRAKYTDQQIGEMPTWIKAKKDQNNITCKEYKVVDINSFSRCRNLHMMLSSKILKMSVLKRINYVLLVLLGLERATLSPLFAAFYKINVVTAITAW